MEQSRLYYCPSVFFLLSASSEHLFYPKKNRLYCSDPYDSEYLRSVPGGYEQLTQPARILRVNFNDRHEVSVKMPGDYNVEFS